MRKWVEVSVSWSQLQIGLTQSWKLCLNLWSFKWFNPSLILVRNFNLLLLSILTYFWPMFPFYTPWKHQKTFGFLVFSWGIKWEHWPEMGEHLIGFRSNEFWNNSLKTLQEAVLRILTKVCFCPEKRDLTFLSISRIIGGVIF